MTPTELTQARESLGLTQSQLARLLELAPVALWRYESGMYKVPKLMRWALLGVAASLQQQSTAAASPKKTPSQHRRVSA